MLRNNPIDIVMTDLAMQPLDGIDLVRLLRNANDSPNPMVPVIMITGHSTLRRVAEARDVGVTEFLSKPVTARGVIERIIARGRAPAPVREDQHATSVRTAAAATTPTIRAPTGALPTSPPTPLDDYAQPSFATKARAWRARRRPWWRFIGVFR